MPLSLTDRQLAILDALERACQRADDGWVSARALEPEGLEGLGVVARNSAIDSTLSQLSRLGFCESGCFTFHNRRVEPDYDGFYAILWSVRSQPELREQLAGWRGRFRPLRRSRPALSGGR